MSTSPVPDFLASDPALRFSVSGRSPQSFSAATQDAVTRASALFARMGWPDAAGRFKVLTMRGPVVGGRRTAYEILIEVVAVAGEAA